MYKISPKKSLLLFLFKFYPIGVLFLRLRKKKMSNNIVIDFVEGARLIGAGLATIGLTGAGVGIELFLEGF